MYYDCRTTYKLVWFFYWCFLFRGTYPVEINFLAKKELFKFPLGPYLKWMGGIALDRSKTENKVDAIAKIFETKDVLRLSLSPEGTRKKLHNGNLDIITLRKKQMFL